MQHQDYLSVQLLLDKKQNSPTFPKLKYVSYALPGPSTTDAPSYKEITPSFGVSTQPYHEILASACPLHLGSVSSLLACPWTLLSSHSDSKSQKKRSDQESTSGRLWYSWKSSSLVATIITWNSSKEQNTAFSYPLYNFQARQLTKQVVML